MRPEEIKLRQRVFRNLHPALEHLTNLTGASQKENNDPVNWEYVETRLVLLIESMQMLRDLVKNFRDEQAQKGGGS